MFNKLGTQKNAFPLRGHILAYSFGFDNVSSKLSIEQISLDKREIAKGNVLADNSYYFASRLCLVFSEICPSKRIQDSSLALPLRACLVD